LAQNYDLPWTEPGWFDQASAWIHVELERHDLHVTGPIDLLHRRAWSAFARVPTTGGIVYFKAPAPAMKFESVLTQALADWRPDCTVPLLATDPERGWMLSSDAGVTLRSLITSPDDLGHWHKALPLYAEFQIDLATRVPELLALGMPDRRLAELPNLYEELLADTQTLRLGLAQGLTLSEHRRLQDLRPRFAALCQELASMGLPETIAHEEIHDANVILSDGRYIFTDWSDSSVAHPFFTMLVTLRSAAYRLKLDEGGPEMMRLRNIYLDSWTAFAPQKRLLAAFRIAYRLAMVNRSLSYHRVLSPLPEAYRVENDSTVGWLQDFLEAETKVRD
jgi:Phosphotransferase enzyme family